MKNKLCWLETEVEIVRAGKQNTLKALYMSDGYAFLAH